MGLAGAIVVACAVAYALTLLPALLAVLGPRINRGRVPLPRLADRPGAWHALSKWVMRHPLLVLAPTLGALLLIGSPFLRLRMAATDITALPPSAEARRGAVELARYFPREAANRIVVAAEFPSEDAFTPQRVGALYDFSRKLAALPGVTAVESMVDLDPSLDRAAYQQLASMPRSFLPAEFEIAERSFIAGRVTVLYALTVAAAAYRKRNSMRRDSNLTVLVPDWLVDQVKLDMAMDGDEGLDFWAIPDSQVTAAFGNVNLNPVYYADAAAAVSAQAWDAPQAAGKLNDFPTTAVAYLYAPGTWVKLDGGTLDVGLVRDSTLNRTNDLELFMEEWVGTVMLGLESVAITITGCANGAAADHVTPFTCPTTP